MPHPAYLHIGPPKTGSTYVQQLLWLNRDHLLAQGILYPARNRAHHFQAAGDVVDHGAMNASKADLAGRWQDLCSLAAAHDGPVVISHELFSAATADNVRTVVGDLADRELHVLFTARNVRALFESRFQEGFKNGRTWTAEEFVERSLRSQDSSELHVGRSGKALRTWAQAVPPERFHVITMPPPGSPRTLLFDRFCSVIGFDTTDAVLETSRVNESIGAVEAELLRRIASRPGADWSPSAQLYLKHDFVPRVLAGRKGQRRISFCDPEVLRALREQTRLMVALIEELGLHVVGDLAELEAAQSALPTAAEGAESTDVSDAELVEVALEGLRWFARNTSELEAERKLLKKQVRRLQAARTKHTDLISTLRAARQELRDRLSAVQRG
ncbi:MAG: hypothetical protein M3419_10050 [Actinomycetota bacterium]|nr:hypothetical protein [Actinomycetota bacterium]